MWSSQGEGGEEIVDRGRYQEQRRQNQKTNLREKETQRHTEVESDNQGKKVMRT